MTWPFSRKPKCDHAWKMEAVAAIWFRYCHKCDTLQRKLYGPDWETYPKGDARTRVIASVLAGGDRRFRRIEDLTAGNPSTGCHPYTPTAKAVSLSAREETEVRTNPASGDRPDTETHTPGLGTSASKRADTPILAFAPFFASRSSRDTGEPKP